MVARNVEFDVFKIVLARTADGDHAAIVRAAVIRSAASGRFGSFVEQVIHSMYARGSRSPPKSFSKSSPRSLDFLRTGRCNCGRVLRSARLCRASGMEPASGLKARSEPASNIVRTASFCQQVRRAIPAILVRAR